jgi:hypothetical protein
LKRQAILVAIAVIVFMPLSHYLGKAYGASGVCWALVLVHLPVALSNPLEAVLVRKNWTVVSVMKLL